MVKKLQPLEENVLMLPESKQEEQKIEEVKDEEALELLNKIRHITKHIPKTDNCNHRQLLFDNLSCSHH